MKALRRRRPASLSVAALLVALLAALAITASASSAPAVKLSISGGSSTIQAGGTTALYTVSLSNAVGPATVALSSTSSAGKFSDSGGGTVTSVAIPTGATTATFAYSDTKAGSPKITAVASGSGFKGKPSATQQLTVTAAAVAQIALSPTTSTIDTSGQQQYAVTAEDQYGNSSGDVTAGTSFSVGSGASCSNNTCSSSTPGSYTVTATYQSLTATATLTVTAAPAPSCQTSGPTGGAYTLNVCVTPGGGTTVHGNTNVTATVSVTGTDPHTAKTLFTLDGQYLITDFQYSSYTHTTGSATYVYNFLLPSANWVDGTHTLAAQAIERDGFTSVATSGTLMFSNGVTRVPPAPTGFQPTPGTNPAPGAPFVLAAVGDGADGSTGATADTNLIASWSPNLFFYLGDVYEQGSPTEFLNWYGTSGGAFYGQFDPITDPVVGNHEYTAGKAPGYFSYWHTPPDYYSFNSHGWHFIALNSNLDGSPGSAQYTWLQNDLQHDTQACTLAYYHHPLFNIGIEPLPARFQPIWPLLAQHGVDIVLNGHDHDYQRWVPMDGNGTPTPGGTTEFVDGAGGHGLQSFVSTDSRVAYSLTGTFGALQLDLNPGGASYQYITVDGGTADSGTITCNPSVKDLTAPSNPTNLNGVTVAQTSISPGLVNLSWSPSTDNVAVAAYRIYRDGTLLATVGPQTYYSDGTVAQGTTYSYQVQAVDPSGNASGLSTALGITTPGQASIFSDGFESGDLSNWDTVAGLTVENAEAFDGTWAAESIGGGTNVAYAWKTLPSTQQSLYYQFHFRVVSQSSNVTLMRLRSAVGASGGNANAILGAYVSSTGRLDLRNDINATNITSSSVVNDGLWHTLQVHVDIGTGQIDTWLDGSPVAALTTTGNNLGTDPVGIVQIGENQTGRSAFDVRYDDVAVDTVPLS